MYKNLHTFSGSDCHSSNLFQASDGNLYGTLANCSIAGTRARVRVQDQHRRRFQGNLRLRVRNRWQTPCTGVIQGKDGKLYGATNQGAANGIGNIYKLTTAGVDTDFHDFTNATDASCVNNDRPTPVNLLQVTDGTFYGVNPAYGANGTGSIYKLTSANVFSAFLFPNPPVDGRTAQLHADSEYERTACMERPPVAAAEPAAAPTRAMAHSSA